MPVCVCECGWVCECEYECVCTLVSAHMCVEGIPLSVSRKVA